LTCQGNFSPEQKENIASILIKEKFSPGEFIVHEGDNADSYYIIQKVNIFSLFKLEYLSRELYQYQKRELKSEC